MIDPLATGSLANARSRTPIRTAPKPTSASQNSTKSQTQTANNPPIVHPAPQAAGQITAHFAHQQLSLGNEHFGIQLNLGEALLAQVLLNSALADDAAAAEITNQQLITHFCQNLMTSLSLLPSRPSQLAINELELNAQACLLKKLANQPEQELLVEKISSRRLSQAKEEASYLNNQLKAEEEIRQFLLPAFNQLEAYLQEKGLTWPDPEGSYY